MAIRGVMFDVDGTLVRGDDPIPGAEVGVEAVRAAGLRRVFVSNNPTKPPADYERRLGRAGFAVDAEAVITAGSVTARYLSEHHSTAEIAVVGEPGLVSLLDAAGLSVTRVAPDADSDGSIPAEPELTAADPGETAPDVLVASLDREFRYDTLRDYLWLLQDHDVTFLGTDPDVVIPAAEGNVPGSGAVIDAIANVAGRDPAAVLGKPSDVARDAALDLLELPPAEVLVVGDRLDTDIALGDGAGMTTALVRTGVTDDTDLAASPIEPDYVIDSLAALADMLPSLTA